MPLFKSARTPLCSGSGRRSGEVAVSADAPRARELPRRGQPRRRNRHNRCSQRHPYTQSLLSAVSRTATQSSEDRIVLEGDVPSPEARHQDVAAILDVRSTSATSARRKFLSSMNSNLITGVPVTFTTNHGLDREYLSWCLQSVIHER